MKTFQDYHADAKWVKCECGNWDVQKPNQRFYGITDGITKIIDLCKKPHNIKRQSKEDSMIIMLNSLAQQVSDLQEVIKAHHSVGWTPISRDCKVCQI